MRQVVATDILTLAHMARITFADTFAANTAPEDMQKFLDTAYAPEQLTRELRTAGTTFWFVTVDGTPAGYMKLNVGEAVTKDVKATNALELERIYILPDYKRHGLGSLLYKKAVELARAQGKEKIALGVWEHNEPAKSFYVKRGFQKVGDHSFVVGSDLQHDWLMEAAV